MSVYRSKVMVGSDVIAILPTWSDGALVLAAARAAGRDDISVQDGEWHFAGQVAPDVTHPSYAAVLADLRI